MGVPRKCSYDARIMPRHATRHTDPAERGAVFRRTHERFLTRALSEPGEFPRIPVRRVADGGFDTLRRRPRGLTRAEQWWSAALARVGATD